MNSINITPKAFQTLRPQARLPPGGQPGSSPREGLSITVSASGSHPEKSFVVQKVQERLPTISTPWGVTIHILAVRDLYTNL